MSPGKLVKNSLKRRSHSRKSRTEKGNKEKVVHAFCPTHKDIAYITQNQPIRPTNACNF